MRLAQRDLYSGHLRVEVGQVSLLLLSCHVHQFETHGGCREVHELPHPCRAQFWRCFRGIDGREAASRRRQAQVLVLADQHCLREFFLKRLLSHQMLNGHI